MENVKIDLLRNISLFSSLTDEELLKNSGKVAVEEFLKNEVILREEDANEFMYIILDGKVKVVQSTVEGKEIILAIHQSMDFFGEVSVIDGETSPATVVAIEDSLIAIISRRDFFSLLVDQPKILKNLLRILCARLRESWNRIHLLNFKNASQRVKMLFLSFPRESDQQSGEGILIPFKLTHQDIADMAGLTRETVTRVLDKWQNEGEITVLKNRFIRLNPKFLEKDHGSQD